MGGGEVTPDENPSAFNCHPQRGPSGHRFLSPAQLIVDEMRRDLPAGGFGLRLGGLTPDVAASLGDLARSTDLTLVPLPPLSGGGPVPPGRALLSGNPRQLRALADLLKERPGSPWRLGAEIEECLDAMERPRRFLARGRDLLEGRACLIMGVLNLTPDSFSDGGRFVKAEDAVTRGMEMAEEGADLLDLGAESSRPGSEPVAEEEEKRRLLPVLQALRRALPDVPLSVDTTKASVAEAALDAGADVINDISGGRMDAAMVPLCARRGATLILMHMRGTPKIMQESPCYEDPVAEITAELRACVAAAESAGLGPGQLAVDPGIGFAKRPQDNLSVLAHLEALTCLGHPILVGASRKSLIGALTGADVADRLPGTLALHTAALLNGAQILRVHDVKEHRQALACAAALLR